MQEATLAGAHGAPGAGVRKRRRRRLGNSLDGRLIGFPFGPVGAKQWTTAACERQTCGFISWAVRRHPTTLFSWYSTSASSEHFAGGIAYMASRSQPGACACSSCRACAQYFCRVACVGAQNRGGVDFWVLFHFNLCPTHFAACVASRARTFEFVQLTRFRREHHGQQFYSHMSLHT